MSGRKFRFLFRGKLTFFFSLHFPFFPTESEREREIVGSNARRWGVSLNAWLLSCFPAAAAAAANAVDVFAGGDSDSGSDSDSVACPRVQSEFTREFSSFYLDSAVKQSKAKQQQHFLLPPASVILLKSWRASLSARSSSCNVVRQRRATTASTTKKLFLHTLHQNSWSVNREFFCKSWCCWTLLKNLACVELRVVDASASGKLSGSDWSRSGCNLMLFEKNLLLFLLLLLLLLPPLWFHCRCCLLSFFLFSSAQCTLVTLSSHFPLTFYCQRQRTLCFGCICLSNCAFACASTFVQSQSVRQTSADCVWVCDIFLLLDWLMQKRLEERLLFCCFTAVI